MRKWRLRYLVFSFGVLMMISGIAGNWIIQTNFGQVTTTEVQVVSSENTTITGLLQIPKSASSTNPVPGILVVHGFGGSKDLMISFGIELARRKFVVLTIDAEGHGNSDPGSSSEGILAAEFLSSMPEVEGIGVIGHSMGAGIVLDAVQDPIVSVRATVLVAGGPSSSALTWMNTSYPQNLLVAIGFYDELYDIPSFAASLSDLFDTSGPVEIDRQYGAFNDGTARKLITPPSNHLFEPADPFIIGSVVDWLESSFNHENTGLASQNLIYFAHYLGGFIASFGLFVTVFPLFTILLDQPVFQSLQGDIKSSYTTTNRNRWLWGMFYGGLGLASFFPFVFVGSVIPFPQLFGASFAIWLLGSGIISILVLLLLRKRQRIEFKWNDFGGLSGSFPTNKSNFIKGVILGGIVFLWLYGWTILIDNALALDFRAFFPIFNDLTLGRFLIFPIYVVLITPFFYAEGLWLFGHLRSRTPHTAISDQTKWIFEGSMLKVVPYLLLTIAQYGPILLIGRLLFKGSVGFILLFLLPFSPMFIVTTCIIGWSYLKTGKVFTGSFISALILSWILASILPM